MSTTRNFQEPREQEAQEHKFNLTDLHKLRLVDKLTACHGYNVLENNPWMQTVVKEKKKKKKVSFKPTEIFGREAILPQCMNNHDLTIKLGNLHAPTCANSSQETVEVLGQYAWMNRKFLISCRYKQKD
jgi:hypothetical protein